LLPKAIRTRRGPLVLLFYDGFELTAEPGISGRLYSQSRGAARYVYRTIRRKQVWTGFYTAFKSLCLCLRQAGCDVRVNDFALALSNPSYPVGLAGYPSVLSKVSLSNPVIFGPGDYGDPDAAVTLVREPRIRKLIQPCEWAADLYREGCGERMMVWPVGIDTDLWHDESMQAKSVDVLVYDKIRWHREREVPRVLQRVTDHLQACGRTFATLRYGHHHHDEFRRGLRHSRSMIFLCEHETQGLACEEALASNVPVLAWDEGVLVDPHQRRFAKPDLVVSSVPYFDERCGETFRIAEFEKTFSLFWDKLGGYRPRQYVLENLSLARSAEAYLAAYASLM
jgi:hypothetical protein